jgi:hypothetical protein
VTGGAVEGTSGAELRHRNHAGKFIKRFSNSTAKHVPALNTLLQLQISLLKKRGEEKFNDPRGSPSALGPSSPHSERAGTRY